jgi:molybdenum cofactor guanylyltransferase
MLTGVILAGGQNRRMGGKPKALLPFGGRPILERQLEEMAVLCPQILVVANAPQDLAPIVSAHQFAKVQIIPDLYPGTGPLGGLHAALHSSENECVWVVGCDMPHISATAAGMMLAACKEASNDAVLPVIQGKIHPLHGIYHSRIKPIVEALLQQKQYKMMGLLERIRWLQADQSDFLSKQIDLAFVTNLNTNEEYLRAVQADKQ